MQTPKVPGYTLRLYRVLSEDPWRTELLEERRYTGWEEAQEAFVSILERLEGEGYTCMDHASAWTQLCTRVVAVERETMDGLGEVEVPVLEKKLLALELEPTG